MSNTRYANYTSRETTIRPGKKASVWQKISVFLVSLGVIIGLIIGGGWWLKTQLAELFMTKQPVTVMLVDPQPGSQVGPWIFQLQPDAKKIVWVNLPPEIQTELFSGYGQYGVSSVYPLLMIEKKSPAYVQASLGAIAGRLLSRVEPWSGLKTWQQQVQAAKLELVEFNPAHRRLAGQPVKEIVKMSWQKIWSDQTSWRAKKSFLYEFKTSLGWYWFIQQARLKWQWSSQLSDLIATAPKAAIDCPVVVVNASQSQGLAKQIGTLLTNTGYEVIRISAETAIIEDSALWLDPNQADKCQGVALSVGGAIPTTPELKLDAEKTARYRAPIVLIVGLDNAR